MKKLDGRIFSYHYSFLASGNFCRLLITFANSLDLDQDRKILLVLIWIQTIRHSDGVPESFFKIVSRRQQNRENLPSMQRVEIYKITTGRDTTKYKAQTFSQFESFILTIKIHSPPIKKKNNNEKI